MPWAAMDMWSWACPSRREAGTLVFGVDVGPADIVSWLCTVKLPWVFEGADNPQTGEGLFAREVGRSSLVLLWFRGLGKPVGRGSCQPGTLQMRRKGLLCQPTRGSEWP